MKDLRLKLKSAQCQNVQKPNPILVPGVNGQSGAAVLETANKESKRELDSATNLILLDDSEGISILVNALEKRSKQQTAFQNLVQVEADLEEPYFQKEMLSCKSLI